jgi:hypothetical protein
MILFGIPLVSSRCLASCKRRSPGCAAELFDAALTGLMPHTQNVPAQLVLWESETQRVMSNPATLYSNFEDDDLFEASSSHAQSLGVMLWVDNSQRMFAVQRLGKRLGNLLGKRLGNLLGKQLGNLLGKRLGNLLGKRLGNLLGKQLGNLLGKRLGNLLLQWCR